MVLACFSVSVSLAASREIINGIRTIYNVLQLALMRVHGNFSSIFGTQRRLLCLFNFCKEFCFIVRSRCSTKSCSFSVCVSVCMCVCVLVLKQFSSFIFTTFLRYTMLPAPSCVCSYFARVKISKNVVSFVFHHY